METTWLPFELHPEVPPEGMPREQILPAEYLARADANIQAMAAAAGLSMKPRQRLINTRLALATAEFARHSGVFEPVHKALFKAHWEGTANLDRVEDLKTVAASMGLDADELEAEWERLQALPPNEFSVAASLWDTPE